MSPCGKPPSVPFFDDPIFSLTIVTIFQEEDATSGIGRTVYDADCLDKLGHMGVAQFFSKGALRRRFLDEKLMIRAGIELTYAPTPRRRSRLPPGDDWPASVSEHTPFL